MGSLSSTLARLQCSHLDTWGNREQEPCLHYSHKCQVCVPYHDCMPFSSMIHYHQLQVAAMAAVVAVVARAVMVAVVAKAVMVAKDVAVAKAVVVARDATVAIMDFKGFMELLGHHRSMGINLLI